MALGIPVAELQTRMTSAEFTEWQAYYSDEPFGDLRADFRTGILASQVKNLLAGKDDKRAEPIDFVIHGDAHHGGESETVLTAEPDDLAVAHELRKRSQESMIAALRALPSKG